MINTAYNILEGLKSGNDIYSSAEMSVIVSGLRIEMKKPL